jgi:SAM-dependent methyltransferase
MKTLMKITNEKVLFPFRRSFLSKKLVTFLDTCETVLDLGASCGRLANEIKNLKPSLKFEGVDVYIQPDTAIKVTKYDGLNIPFEENSFDAVTIVDVLHHSEDLEQVIKEAKRVSKKYILIKDHYYENQIEYNLLKYVDYFGNKPYDIELKYNFLKLSEWERIFSRNGLKIVEEHRFKYMNIDPCNHIIYLLEK